MAGQLPPTVEVEGPAADAAAASADLASPQAPASEPRPLPKAKFPFPIQLIADAMNALSKSTKGQASGQRALQGGQAPAVAPVMPTDPGAVLGAARVGIDVVGAIAEENKTLALIVGGVVLVGLLAFGISRVTANASKRRNETPEERRLREIAEQEERAQRQERRGVAARLAGFRHGGLQAPEFEGRADPSLTD